MIGTDNVFGEDRACNSGYGSQIANAILSRVICVAQQVVSHGDVVPQPCGDVPAPSDERHQINVLLASWYAHFNAYQHSFGALAKPPSLRRKRAAACRASRQKCSV